MRSFTPVQKTWPLKTVHSRLATQRRAGGGDRASARRQFETVAIRDIGGSRLVLQAAVERRGRGRPGLVNRRHRRPRRAARLLKQKPGAADAIQIASTRLSL